MNYSCYSHLCILMQVLATILASTLIFSLMTFSKKLDLFRFNNIATCVLCIHGYT